MAEREEELACLQTQVGERQRAWPLMERIKTIFQQHGGTMTAVFLAVGATIGAILSAITNAFKNSAAEAKAEMEKTSKEMKEEMEKSGKEMKDGLASAPLWGGSLKMLGNKLSSPLPGLIGQVAHYIFKTAGRWLNMSLKMPGS